MVIGRIGANEYEPSRTWIADVFEVAFGGGLFGGAMRCMWSMREGMRVTGRLVFLTCILGTAAGILSSLVLMLTEFSLTGQMAAIGNEARLAQDSQHDLRMSLIVVVGAIFSGLYIDAAFARFDSLKGRFAAGPRTDESP